ncbi:MAG: hypothetical protein J6W28_06935 [Clostridia bacterium]|nr:hypothetical protein [Clostridia bacterium]
MVLSKDDVRRYTTRLLLSRNRLLQSNSFYGLLLMHMRFFLDEECATAYTDGERIAFSPAFMDQLSDRELDFVMMHEILHVVLEHCMRTGDRDNALFNCACDIVVNSNIRLSNGDDPLSITLSAFGESMNVAPNGKPGHLYTAEEVYEMFPASEKQKAESGKGQGDGKDEKDEKGGGGNSGDKDQKGSSGCSATDKGSKNGISSGKSGKNAKGQGDIWDDHSHWKEPDDSELSDTWRARVAAAAAVLSIEEASDGCGSLPAGIDRLLKERHRSQVDWRTMLQEFVQEEICDWSFSPPDRRFGDSPFFLPDFNDTVERVRNILFMVDTSGSISDDMLAHAYSEVAAAVDQFGGAFEGYLGFFDAEVYEPIPFSSVDDLLTIRPKGGGGTSFHAVFDHVRQKVEEDNAPACLIMLTDGYAAFPDERDTLGVPVLWLIINESITPPYGKVARIKI